MLVLFIHLLCVQMPAPNFYWYNSNNVGKTNRRIYLVCWKTKRKRTQTMTCSRHLNQSVRCCIQMSDSDFFVFSQRDSGAPAKFSCSTNSHIFRFIFTLLVIHFSLLVWLETHTIEYQENETRNGFSRTCYEYNTRNGETNEKENTHKAKGTRRRMEFGIGLTSNGIPKFHFDVIVVVMVFL